MTPNETEQDLINKGIEAKKLGNIPNAQAFFARALSTNPKSEEAWLNMAQVIDDVDKQKECYEKVLEINPQNAVAKAWLLKSTQLEKEPAYEPVEMFDEQAQTKEVNGPQVSYTNRIAFLVLMIIVLIAGYWVWQKANVDAQNTAPSATTTQSPSGVEAGEWKFIPYNLNRSSEGDGWDMVAFNLAIVNMTPNMLYCDRCYGSAFGFDGWTITADEESFTIQMDYGTQKVLIPPMSSVNIGHYAARIPANSSQLKVQGPLRRKLFFMTNEAEVYPLNPQVDFDSLSFDLSEQPVVFPTWLSQDHFLGVNDVPEQMFAYWDKGTFSIQQFEVQENMLWITLDLKNETDQEINLNNLHPLLLNEDIVTNSAPDLLNSSGLVRDYSKDAPIEGIVGPGQTSEFRLGFPNYKNPSLLYFCVEIRGAYGTFYDCDDKAIYVDIP